MELFTLLGWLTLVLYLVYPEYLGFLHYCCHKNLIKPSRFSSYLKIARHKLKDKTKKGRNVMKVVLLLRKLLLISLGKESLLRAFNADYIYGLGTLTV